MAGPYYIDPMEPKPPHRKAKKKARKPTVRSGKDLPAMKREARKKAKAAPAKRKNRATKATAVRRRR